MRVSGSRMAVPLVGVLFCAPIAAQVTQRVSVDSNGIGANSYSFTGRISADGRFVAFQSEASNLVPGDTNGLSDVFVRDIQAGTTEMVSVGAGGTLGNGHSGLDGCSISADGRFVAFSSHASNLVVGDTNGQSDIFVRDRQGGATELVSLSSSGAQANLHCTRPSISADGRYVAFFSGSSTLVVGDTNGHDDVFVRDRLTGMTERVSVSSGGAEGNGDSVWPSITADGRFVTFNSNSDNLVPGDTNGWSDVFVRDRQSGTTERANVSTLGEEANRDGGLNYDIGISGDGRYVAFNSQAINLVPGDTNNCVDVFLRDRLNGTTELISLPSSVGLGNAYSYGPSISSDGRFVSFYSWASNLVPGDTGLYLDVFVRDRLTATTHRLSVDASGAEGNEDSKETSISADGRFVVYSSRASNLVIGDTNGVWDVYAHDGAATGFTSLCDPGAGSVIACPCSNPPTTSERGCDNSFATGGASLSATGGASLSSDSLVFTTNGQRLAATSVLLQGDALDASGAIYGQGVRCVGGALKRLFVKGAVGGSITAPDFAAGDPTVSARSAAKGDVIQPGQSRYYLVYYRDPVVLGGCPASSTFNATQTGQVTWWP